MALTPNDRSFFRKKHDVDTLNTLGVEAGLELMGEGNYTYHCVDSANEAQTVADVDARRFVGAFLDVVDDHRQALDGVEAPDMLSLSGLHTVLAAESRLRADLDEVEAIDLSATDDPRPPLGPGVQHGIHAITDLFAQKYPPDSQE